MKKVLCAHEWDPVSESLVVDLCGDFMGTSQKQQHLEIADFDQITCPKA